MVNQPKLVNKMKGSVPTGAPDHEEDQALAVLRLPGKEYLAIMPGTTNQLSYIILYSVG